MSLVGLRERLLGFGKEEEGEEEELSLYETREGLREDERARIPMVEERNPKKRDKLDNGGRERWKKEFFFYELK
ncbi:hypothetical protein Bca4012_065273 [Brassica carinata]